ncbi:MAG TPA: SpoIIE family protein phosphatase [Baekduia sp.]|uniref:SpoIIE family protein phosphatase n=1 Tax=Baekduia sp. TaxID=2600305 RepID=UPI002D7953AE|nr:SpoIIE family protein phosphatase [Baekduia sp.]HET6509528.1 SpoIIE family protein phosphatase [Baekduia sp.]
MEASDDRTAGSRALPPAILGLLARVADLLEAPLDAPVMLERLSGLFVPELGDVVVVDLLQDDGTLRGAVTAAVDPAIADDLRTLREQHPISTESEHPVAQALRLGEPYVLQDLRNEVHRYADSPEHVRHVVGFDYESVLSVPLVGRRARFGAISFVRRAGRDPFTPDEVTLGRIIGARASLALDNARLLADLRETEGRLEAIVENLGEAVAAIAPDGTLRFANAAAAEFAGAESAAALVAGGGGMALLARWNVFDEAGRPIAPEDYLVVRALAGETPAPRIHHVVERETGRDRWLMTRAAPVADAAGDLDFVVWVGEDMTAVKRQEMRERLLSNASKLLGSSLDVDATIDKAAWAVVPELADWARVDLLDERGTLVQMAIAHRDIEKVELLAEWRRDFPPPPEHDRGPFAVLRSGRSIVWSSVSDEDVAAYAQAPRHRELMESIGTRSMLIVPMIVGEELIGTMQLASTGESGRMLGEADLELAEELARRASIAVAHARLHAARTHVATTLQRSLLPPRLPVIPGLTIAARFRAAGTASEVGGDFYDLFESRDRWMVLMGDVTGKGPGAAAITSLARYTMRTVAQYEDDPTVMLGRLNATLGSDPERRQICTAVCVEVLPREADPADRPGAGARLRIVCAGHPSPLLVRRDGGDVDAVGRPGTLLGAFPEGRWSVTDVELGDGDSLVLYTDGVTDTRGPDGRRFGSERLEETLRAIGPAEAEEIAGGIDAALRAFGEQRDDVAVLVLSGTAFDDPRSIVVGSTPEPRAA